MNNEKQANDMINKALDALDAYRAKVNPNEEHLNLIQINLMEAIALLNNNNND